MYSQSEIQSAIDAGIIDPNAAEKLQNHIAQKRKRPIQDEEHFKLVTGFNDIFVAIAAIIMLFAVSAIGAVTVNFLAGFFVAATAWGLAEFFTLKRRMAFPSIILLLAFVGGVFASAVIIIKLGGAGVSSSFAAASIITAIAAFLHWRRFKVPITVAAGIGALAATFIFSFLIPLESQFGSNIALILTLIAGLGIFSTAMWWDISDKTRETGRSDVAFWLHLLAAPLIAHPLFYFIGATSGVEISGLQAAAVMITYIMMGLIAITIDRRAMLVSALAYVLAALAFLFNQFGFIELNIALTAFVIGSTLLLLSAFWSNLRNAIVTKMPDIIRNNVPATI